MDELRKQRILELMHRVRAAIYNPGTTIHEPPEVRSDPDYRGCGYTDFATDCVELCNHLEIADRKGEL